ncbi:MAG: hypothetical protein SNJ79_00490 [Sphingomonadaceae bacterium]
MTTYEKTSLSLPADLFEAVSQAAQADDQSRSQKVAELIRLGLTARQQFDALYRENARLKQTIEGQAARLASAEASLKKVDPRDYLTGAPPGTAKLREDLEWSEKARRQAEADAAEASRQEEQLRIEIEELQAELADQDDEIGQLKERCSRVTQEGWDSNRARVAALKALQAEQARKVPWYWRLTLPDIRIHRVNVGYPAPHSGSWWRGFLACAFWFGFGLFATPHELPPMQYVASAAMGTWGDIPLAAARLHGGPYSGHETALQRYALLRAGENPARLDRCIERAAKLKPMAKPINCTIHVPSEFELYADIRMSGPDAHTSRVKQRLDERIMERRRLERALGRAVR